jgi:hypothetical protein
LYPNKDLPKFLEKNNIPKASIEKSALLTQLLAASNSSLVNMDCKGEYHFNGNFHNANDLKAALEQLQKQAEYRDLVEKESEFVLQIFEEVFNHKAFTGRSGTFYGYEGLGSIYWHMVSKLHLAVLEVIEKAYQENVDASVIAALSAHYEEIGAGIGVHKSPEVYGAFPTDPYSHTPSHRGAQQPGMTGQVKEDILTRKGELGITVNEGRLSFAPALLNKNQFLSQEETVVFNDLVSNTYSLKLEKGSLAFTVCQVPVIYCISDKNQIEVVYKNSNVETISSLILSHDISQQIFHRSGEISQLKVSINI